jgi:ABC-type molybdate transport system substrate-binding protein
MARSWVRLFAGATLTLSLTGHALADEGKITVFAAASLTNALQDIAAAYKREKRRGGLLVCLFLDAGAPDRSGRTGGSVHLG